MESSVLAEISAMQKMLCDNQIEQQRLKAFVQAALDSLPVEVCVLDHAGVIVMVNEPWRRFALENSSIPGKPAPRSDVGTNYLEVCRNSTGGASNGAMEAYEGILAVMDGRLTIFNFEYSCHSSCAQRWFVMAVSKLGEGQDGVVIAHHNITERKLAEEKVHNLAFYDELTKLPNRRLMNDRLTQALAASKRNESYGALMFMDLDNFKPLNDEHGHVVGDMLLAEVAVRLNRCVREVDTVARFGGDEFVVMISELSKDLVSSTSQAKVVAEKIRASLAEPYLLTIQREGLPDITVEHHCTVTIGVAMFDYHESCQHNVLKWADMAMYQAKALGRNQIYFHALDA
jgi:diguanylate cyclase (GGDEF)-like protein